MFICDSSMSQDRPGPVVDQEHGDPLLARLVPGAEVCAIPLQALTLVRCLAEQRRREAYRKFDHFGERDLLSRDGQLTAGLGLGQRPVAAGRMTRRGMAFDGRPVAEHDRDGKFGQPCARVRFFEHEKKVSALVVHGEAARGITEER